LESCRREAEAAQKFLDAELKRQADKRRLAHELEERRGADEIVQWGGEFWGGVSGHPATSSRRPVQPATAGAEEEAVVEDEEEEHGLEDMLPVEEAVREEDMVDAVMAAIVADGAGYTEEDMVDAVMAAIVADGAGDTEEDDEPVTQ
jgi:hypothetical protein